MRNSHIASTKDGSSLATSSLLKPAVLTLSLLKSGELRLRIAVVLAIVVIVAGIGLVDANVSRAPVGPLPGCNIQ